MARNSWLLLLVVLVAATGCRTIGSIRNLGQPDLILTATQAQAAQIKGAELFAQQPRSLEQVRRAAVQLQAAAQALSQEYGAQWPAAEALAFLAEFEPSPASRAAAAKAGILLARRARELQPDQPQGHYWYAINTGLLADVDRAYGLDAVTEMESALRQVLRTEERYDYGGAHRLLGILHLRTPPPPTSIGSARKGLRALQRAVELFPEYPENQLYLAEALRQTGRPEESRAALRKVVESPPWPQRQWESARWRANAQAQLDKP